MTRLDLLPENDFPARINAILDDIDALNKAQTIGGDSIKRYKVQSGNEFDINIAIPATVKTYLWRIVFKADHPEQISLYSYQTLASWTPDSGAQSYGSTEDPEYLKETGYQSIIFNFLNSTAVATNLKVKFTFYAGDTGTLEVTRIS